MKRVFILLIALLIAFALVGCNIAPNVPGVTPYGNNGNGYNTRGNYNAGPNGLYGVTGEPGTNGNGMTRPAGTGAWPNGTNGVGTGINSGYGTGGARTNPATAAR